MKSTRTWLHWLVDVRLWGYGLFWSWNLIFLAFMSLGFAPLLLPETINSVRRGLTPPIFLVYILALTGIPVAAVLLGLTRLRRHPARLLALGYGVEGPLMLLLLLRFFVIRDATPIVNAITVLAGTGLAVFLWDVLDLRSKPIPFGLGLLRLAGKSLVVILGLYAAALIVFYAVPILAQVPYLLGEISRSLWQALLEVDWYSLTVIPFLILGSMLGFYTATLLVGMPIAVPALYIRAWLRELRDLAGRAFAPQAWLPARAASIIPAAIPAAVSALALVGSIGALLALNRQPQHRAYELLKDPPATIEQAQALTSQESSLRAGLLNAYLAPLRYVGAVGEVGHIRELYHWGLKLEDEQAAEVQSLFEAVIRPLLYEPMNPEALESKPLEWWEQRALTSDPPVAARLYESYFDQPILKGEHDALVNAARSTWAGDQALAAWQAVDDREVLLTEQTLTVVEHGDWAQVELYEQYVNQTSQRQEVVYFFSLPESAVITGLWLGDDVACNPRCEYVIAPRGAAQQVYREQLRLNLDPALLEQIGPRQYRLRIFPIEPQRWTWDAESEKSILKEGPPLRMWLTYQVFLDGNRWPLPALAERRNVYWDQETTRLYNGQALQMADDDAWLPATLPVTQPARLATHRVDFPGGESVVLRPVSAQELPQLPTDLRLAVVLDRSRSMAAYAAEVEAALVQIKRLSPQAQACLTAPAYSGAAPGLAPLQSLDASSLFYAGGQDAAELLAQFSATCSDGAYDAILVLTDGTGYKLGGQAVTVTVPSVPLWLIHFGGFPLGYDDATLQAIQASGGGAADNLEEAMTRLALALQGAQTSQEGPTYDVGDGFEWITYTPGAAETGTPGATVHSAEDPFAAFAARRVILDTMRRQRAQINDLETLDHLHALATQYSLVTPYSSMLVLVTEAQERRLKTLSKAPDRYQREGEAAGETEMLSAFQVTGVPEPHEWLLIGVAALLLVGYGMKMRRAKVRTL